MDRDFSEVKTPTHEPTSHFPSPERAGLVSSLSSLLFSFPAFDTPRKRAFHVAFKNLCFIYIELLSSITQALLGKFHSNSYAVLSLFASKRRCAHVDHD